VAGVLKEMQSALEGCVETNEGKVACLIIFLCKSKENQNRRYLPSKNNCRSSCQGRLRISSTKFGTTQETLPSQIYSRNWLGLMAQQELAIPLMKKAAWIKKRMYS